MLKIRSIAVAVMIAVAVATFGFSGSAESETQYQGSEPALCIPMGNFMIHPPASVKQQRASVDFPHAKHFIYKCGECHHKWDNTGSIKTCRTSGCHDQATLTKKPLKDGSYTDAAMKYYKYAYHNKCRGCHQKIGTTKEKMAQSLENIEELPDTGPTGCIACHPK